MISFVLTEIVLQILLAKIAFYYIFRNDDLNDEEKKMMRAITKCTKSFGKCTVEQTATLRAWSNKNQLPVDKYRPQVISELEEQDD